MKDKPHRPSRSVKPTAHHTAISNERGESELSDASARNTPEEVLYLTDTVMHHYNWETRMEAAERLAKIDDPATIRPLIQALRDRDSFVRWKTVRGLKEKGRSATEALIQALNDDNTAIRLGAAYILGSTSDNVVTLALIGALADEEVDVRARAAEALGKIADTDAVSALISALGDRSKIVRGRALQALIHIGQPAIKPLVKTIESGDEALVTRWMAARTLVSIGEPAVEELIIALDHPAWDVRLRTAETLGQIGDPRAVKPLTRLLDDQVAYVRERAAETLGQIGDPRAVKPLVSLLDDPDAHVRMQSKDAIAKIGRPAIKTLILELKRGNRLVRGNVAAALGQIADPQVVKPLVSLLGDPDRFIQNMAVVALVGLGEMSTKQLEAALSNKNLYVRQNATKALGMIGDVTAVDYLIPKLTDQDPSIRAAAAEALGNIGDSRAFAALSITLTDENTFVRATTKDALQKLESRG
jgi:HEAT repeat protein